MPKMWYIYLRPAITHKYQLEKLDNETPKQALLRMMSLYESGDNLDRFLVWRESDYQGEYAESTVYESDEDPDGVWFGSNLEQLERIGGDTE